MDIDKNTEKQIQELQIFEQNLQNILMQKQAFQLELSEIENVLKEIDAVPKEDVYKITGQIMVKADKSEVKKEIVERNELVSIRLKTLDSQEKSISEKIEELRKKVLNKIKK